MVSAANEQRQAPQEPNSAKPESDIALKPVRAADFLTAVRPTAEAEIQLNAAATPRAHATYHEHHLLGSGTVEEEQRNSIAFKYVGAPTNNTSQSPRARLRGAVSIGAEGSVEEEALQSLKDSLPDNKAGLVNGSGASKADRAVEHSAAPAASNQDISGINAKNDLSNGPAQNVEKLLALVGPDAVVNLKARLREVWVDIDSTPATELDVVARMPVTTEGLNASEFLMVKSPQGIHFVAFLRNRNDFEVLQTFDRHALLPGNAPKQLMEAAIMAYEQLGAIFKAGAERLEQRVQQSAKQRDQNQNSEFVTQALRGRWVQSKRRKKKCDDLVEDLVEKIDEINFEESQTEKSQQPEEEESERIIKPEYERPVLENGDEA